MTVQFRRQIWMKFTFLKSSRGKEHKYMLIFECQFFLEVTAPFKPAVLSPLLTKSLFRNIVKKNSNSFSSLAFSKLFFLFLQWAGGEEMDRRTRRIPQKTTRPWDQNDWDRAGNSSNYKYFYKYIRCCGWKCYVYFVLYLRYLHMRHRELAKKTNLP